MARLAVEALLAELSADPEFDPDDALWEIQRAVRARALPLSALQLLAEAQARQLPAWPLPDGGLQLGTGCGSIQIGAAQLGSSRPDLIAPATIGVGTQPPAPFAPDWPKLAAVPVVAVVGADAEAFVAARATALPTGWHSAPSTGFEQLRALLSNQTLCGLLVALDLEDLAARGAALDRFAGCIVRPLPAEAAPDLRRAAQLAQLLTDPAESGQLPPAIQQLLTVDRR